MARFWTAQGAEMTAQHTITGRMTRAQMDALVDGHYRAEEAGDLDAIVEAFTPDAEHDVVGRPGDPLHGGEQIAGFYRALLAELRIDRFEQIRRWYGDDHVVDESVLHATANGNPFGLEGRGRAVRARFLHIFDFGDGLITRESAWIDLAAIQQQLSG
jgi:ketosteroid isomerase-like protein